MTTHGATDINLRWLLRLRWGQVAGQALIVLIASQWLQIALPLPALFVLIALEVATNLAGHQWLKNNITATDRLLVTFMLLDVAVLTTMLYLTGGPFNPFSFLYLINIALGSVILKPAWSWALAVVSLLCFGLLFFDHVPLGSTMQHEAHPMGGGHPMSGHLRGMWFAFGVTAAFVVTFVTRVRRALAEREIELQQAQERSVRSQRLASLATLAAGAAHELSTPLSTIAVVTKELERSSREQGSDPVQLEDLSLIRKQVERCRAILQDMSGEAGHPLGEAWQTVSWQACVREAVTGLPDGFSRSLDADFGELDEKATVHVPRQAVCQAMRAIIKNAVEASAQTRSPVQVRVDICDGKAVLEVIDHGTGMEASVLGSAREPFFTTKGAGKGMGLGLFLAEEIVDKLHGQFELESSPGKGTRVHLAIPLQRAISSLPA